MQNSVKPGISGSMLSLSESIGTPKDISISATPSAKISSLATHAQACRPRCLFRPVNSAVHLGETKKLFVTYAWATEGETPWQHTKSMSSRRQFFSSHGVACNCSTADATVSASLYL